jgi:hypothetical protein
VGANTTNYVSKWNGSALVTGSIFDNGNVGIGTAAPAYNLHVAGSNPSVTIEETSSSNANLIFMRGGVAKWYLLENYLSPVDNIAFYDASVSKKVFQINPGGNVGIGTTSPGAKLHIKGAGFPNSFMYLDTDAAAQDSGLRLYENGVVKGHIYWAAAAGTIKLYHNTGYSGIDIASSGNIGIGTATPAQKLHVAGRYLRVDGSGDEQAYIGGDGAGNDVQVGSTKAGVTAVALWNTASASRMDLYVRQLHVMGGADLSEQFEVRKPDAEMRPLPGMVVSIDAEHPGELVMSSRSYDRAVAGVISGAGGVKTGMIMGQEGSIADGSHPVALTGRVYVMADASTGAIKPGDLMTTSDTPGHAMKVTDHSRAQGAVIGKAMTSLESGTGLVLVLVSLQ